MRERGRGISVDGYEMIEIYAIIVFLISKKEDIGIWMNYGPFFFFARR